MITTGHYDSASRQRESWPPVPSDAMTRSRRIADCGGPPETGALDAKVVVFRRSPIRPTGHPARLVRDPIGTCSMSTLTKSVPKPSQAFTTRQEGILDAAETCFVRNGFHRSTMQDIAREASMSSPNIYRYFVSKEAVLLAMAERERRRAADRIAQFEEAGDKRAALFSTIAYYHLEIPREGAVLRVELWSEATRNSEIEAILREREEQSSAWFIATLAALATSPNCDPVALYGAISALLKGIIVNKAVFPAFDIDPALAQLHALLDAGLAGNLPVQPCRNRTAP